MSSKHKWSDSPMDLEVPPFSCLAEVWHRSFISNIVVQHSHWYHCLSVIDMTTWQVRHQILKKHRFKISKFLNTSCKYEEWTLQIMSKKWKKQTKFGRTFKGPHTHDGFPSHSHKAGIGRRCRNEGPASQEIHIPSVIAQHPGVVTWRAIPFCNFLQSYKTTISKILSKSRWPVC